MGQYFRLLSGLLGLLILGAGCGSGQPDKPKEALTAADAGPNARIKFKEEYKKMIGKDGKMLFKPSESNRRPPGIPKS